MSLEGTLPHALAADPTLSDFNQLIWWMVLLKVGIVFLFLLLTTMFMIWAERRVIGRMQNRSGPNRACLFGLLSRSPTRSSCRSRKTSSPPAWTSWCS